MTKGMAIPTVYRKQLFRSKLEADWARAFDSLGVRYWYEPHGTYYGDIFYCPDFLLPKSRQWVEVKVALMRCFVCNGWWFGDDDESWRCQCCGAYDGNALLSESIGSPLPGWPLCPTAEIVG